MQSEKSSCQCSQAVNAVKLSIHLSFVGSQAVNVVKLCQGIQADMAVKQSITSVVHIFICNIKLHYECISCYFHEQEDLLVLRVISSTSTWSIQTGQTRVQHR